MIDTKKGGRYAEPWVLVQEGREMSGTVSADTNMAVF
jgi:hypothetical protein